MAFVGKELHVMVHGMLCYAMHGQINAYSRYFTPKATSNPSGLRVVSLTKWQYWNNGARQKDKEAFHFY